MVITMKEINVSLIKGANYTPSYACNDLEFWRDYDKTTVEKELAYAKRLGLNCIRVFLNYTVWQYNKDQFLGNLLHLVRTADSNGLKVMPTVFDSCFSEMEPSIDLNINQWIPNPGVMNLGEESWKNEERYCLDLIKQISDEPGLLMWDIMNEPLFTEYIYNYTGIEKQRHKTTVYSFVKHFCEYFKANDYNNPITIGHHDVTCNDETYDWIDILSYHDYSPTADRMLRNADIANERGTKYGKPVFCSETGCPGRANPYDMVIEVLNKKRIGYFLWELMIGKSFWRDRHGIVYPDGTIRDASTYAAINGFFRKRTDYVHLDPDTENCATMVKKHIVSWLESDEQLLEEGMNVASEAANIIESNMLIPEFDLATAVVNALKMNPTKDGIAITLRKWLPVLDYGIDYHTSIMKQ